MTNVLVLQMTPAWERVVSEKWIRHGVLGRAGQVLTRMEAGLMIWMALAREEDMAVS